MSVLLFRREKTQLGQVVLDATLRETHGARVDVTLNPVESGSAITDHRRIQPRQVVIEGVVTNSPLPAPGDPLQNYEISNGRTFQSAGTFDPARAGGAYQQLVELSKSNELVTIETALETYDNMTMTALEVPRNSPTEEIRFTATFVEIRVVENATVEVARVDRGKKKVQQNKKPAKAASAAQEQGSILWYAKQYFNGSTSPGQKADALTKLAGGLPLPAP